MELHEGSLKKQTTGLWPVAFSCGPQGMLMRDDALIVTIHGIFSKWKFADQKAPASRMISGASYFKEELFLRKIEILLSLTFERGCRC